MKQFIIVLILIFTIDNIITFLYQNVNTIFFILDKVVYYCINNVSTFFNHYIYDRDLTALNIKRLLYFAYNTVYKIIFLLLLLLIKPVATMAIGRCTK